MPRGIPGSGPHARSPEQLERQRKARAAKKVFANADENATKPEGEPSVPDASTTTHTVKTHLRANPKRTKRRKESPAAKQRRLEREKREAREKQLLAKQAAANSGLPNLETFEPTAIVLVVEERRCQACRTAHTVPDGLYVLYTLNGAMRAHLPRREWLVKRSRLPDETSELFYDLPTLRRDIVTDVEACHHCVRADGPEAPWQPNLFPRDPSVRKRKIKQLLEEQRARKAAAEGREYRPRTAEEKKAKPFNVAEVF